VKYLSEQDVLIIHAQIIDATGGSHGLRDIGLLSSAVKRPRAAFGGEEFYRGVFQKTAAQFESIAMNHVFIDGNKRTAITASARFLFLNGYELTAGNKKLEDFVLMVVVENVQLEDIARWFKENSRKIKIASKKKNK